jgi:hypothetical protein
MRGVPGNRDSYRELLLILGKSQRQTPFRPWAGTWIGTWRSGSVATACSASLDRRSYSSGTFSLEGPAKSGQPLAVANQATPYNTNVACYWR